MAKVLVVSGGSRGIGFATAQRFAREGYRIINLSRRPCELPDVINIMVDFSAADWSEALAAVLSNVFPREGGRAEVALVHSAAVMTKGEVGGVDSEQFRQCFEVNVVAAAELVKRLLPYMAQGSSVVYVGSTLSEKAVSNTAAYIVSKHALIGLMRSTCQDLAGKGIHTACVCPGFTETEMLLEHIGSDEQVMASIVSGITQQRLLRPDEIADVIYFCSNNAAVNGAVLHANLGQIER